MDGSELPLLALAVTRDGRLGHLNCQCVSVATSLRCASSFAHFAESVKHFSKFP